MDPIKTALRSLLASDPVVSGLVGDRVRPDELDEGDELPAIVIEILEESAVESLDDDGDTRTTTVAVHCCAHRSAQAGELAAAVTALLDGFRGEAADLQLDPITWQQTERDQVSGDDAGEEADWWIVTPQFRIWVRM